MKIEKLTKGICVEIYDKDQGYKLHEPIFRCIFDNSSTANKFIENVEEIMTKRDVLSRRDLQYMISECQCTKSMIETSGYAMSQRFNICIL